MLRRPASFLALSATEQRLADESSLCATRLVSPRGTDFLTDQSDKLDMPDMLAKSGQEQGSLHPSPRLEPARSHMPEFDAINQDRETLVPLVFATPMCIEQDTAAYVHMPIVRGVRLARPVHPQFMMGGTPYIRCLPPSQPPQMAAPASPRLPSQLLRVAAHSHRWNAGGSLVHGGAPLPQAGGDMLRRV